MSTLTTVGTQGRARVRARSTGATTEFDDPRAVARATRASVARKSSGRKRGIDPTTSERDYTAAEVEFMGAMSEYIRTSGRKFPTWSEILGVLRSLGYSKDDPAVAALAG
jgi:hypothetical protein